MVPSVWNPGLSVGTKKAVIRPRRPSSGPRSTRANTTAYSAYGPLLMQILLPDRSQSSPSGVARVRIIRASDPASGSDLAKHIDDFPDSRSGRIRSRTEAVAWTSTWLGPRAQWATTQDISQY